MAHNALVNGVLGELKLTACNFLANVIDDSHGMTLYLKRIFPTQYSGVFCTVRGRTLAVSRTRKRDRGTSISCRASAPAHGSVARLSWSYAFSATAWKTTNRPSWRLRMLFSNLAFAVGPISKCSPSGRGLDRCSVSTTARNHSND